MERRKSNASQSKAAKMYEKFKDFRKAVEMHEAAAKAYMKVAAAEINEKERVSMLGKVATSLGMAVQMHGSCTGQAVFVFLQLALEKYEKDTDEVKFAIPREAAEVFKSTDSFKEDIETPKAAAQVYEEMMNFEEKVLDLVLTPYDYIVLRAFKYLWPAGLMCEIAAEVYGKMERPEERVDMLVSAAKTYERSKNFKVAENMDRKVAAEMTEMTEMTEMVRRRKKQY
jgi:tetratricopeptide (TPR) repeat protein